MKHLRNEKGIALLETLPLLIVFVLLLSFALGLFGFIHTGVLNSIAARTYAFETFRNRTNLTIFREDGSGLTRAGAMSLAEIGWRYHAIQNESTSADKFYPSVRSISFGRAVASADASVESHNVGIYGIGTRNDRLSVSPGWVMVGYGICLTASCGK